MILTQGFVEHSLAEVLLRIGVRRKGMKALIKAAEDAGVVPSDLARRLQKLRRLRNPYVHADTSQWPPAYLRRARTETNGDLYALSDVDARFAMEAGAAYLRHIAERSDRPRQSDTKGLSNEDA